MEKRAKKTICVALALVIALGCFASCGSRRRTQNKVPLRAGVSLLNGVFSPFFALSDGDAAVATLTQESLLTLDRHGRVVYDAVNGEAIAFEGTQYSYTGLASVSVTRDTKNDLTSYTFTLREGVKFSDGVTMDIDDVIFSLYVLLDPSYDGPYTVSSLPITGLRDYQTQTTSEVFDKYAAQFDGIYSDWNEYTDQQRGAWDYVVAKLWEKSGLTELYDSARAYWKDVGTNDNELYEAARHEYICSLGPSDPALALNGVGGISGIERLSDYEVRITVEGFDPDDIYALDIPVAPLHYYGDEEKYDFNAAAFGFDFGDLSDVRDKSSVPRGAGPYKLSGFSDGTAYLEYYSGYWRGRAYTAKLELTETSSPVSDLAGGVIDLAAPAFDAAAEFGIRAANENGELTGSSITTVTLAGQDYWYIGINAQRVSVSEAGSAASKNLRMALATVLAACREKAAAELYGARVALPAYPVSIISSASPDSAAEPYAGAFGVGLDGLPIYNQKMNEDERINAALAAAVDYLVAAGYKYENGRIVSAPEGASMMYTILIPSDAYGRHPANTLIEQARAALSSIGLSLLAANVPDDEFWGILDAGEYEMWCGYRHLSEDPKLYESWESGSDSLHGIRDSALAGMLTKADSSVLQTDRMGYYAQCLETITDWAVEVPLYQSLGCMIYSTGAIASMPPGITPYYNWIECVTDIKMKT